MIVSKLWRTSSSAPLGAWPLAPWKAPAKLSRWGPCAGSGDWAELSANQCVSQTRSSGLSASTPCLEFAVQQPAASASEPPGTVGQSPSPVASGIRLPLTNPLPSLHKHWRRGPPVFAPHSIPSPGGLLRPCLLLQGHFKWPSWNRVQRSSRKGSPVVQLSSVAQSCPTLCDLMTPGLPVHHQLPEFIQTHVHWGGDAIERSHPLSSPSPPAFNLSQHQGLFKWVSTSHQVAKILEFQLQHQPFQ